VWLREERGDEFGAAFRGEGGGFGVHIVYDSGVYWHCEVTLCCTVCVQWVTAEVTGPGFTGGMGRAEVEAWTNGSEVSITAF
jgi:hypothetical protein